MTKEYDCMKKKNIIAICAALVILGVATHFVLHGTAELDEELFEWVSQAYQYAQIK